MLRITDCQNVCVHRRRPFLFIVHINCILVCHSPKQLVSTLFSDFCRCGKIDVTSAKLQLSSQGMEFKGRIQTIFNQSGVRPNFTEPRLILKLIFPEGSRRRSVSELAGMCCILAFHCLLSVYSTP